MQVRDLLESYNELDPAIGPEIAALKLDIDRGLREAGLTEEELLIIEALYLISDPIPPERDRPNRSGGTSGRPPGGITQQHIAAIVGAGSDKSLNALNIMVSRRVRSACGKIAAYLGGPYE